MLAAMPGDAKRELGCWLMDTSLSADLTRKLHYLGRGDVHKLAKEAFVCLAESCSKEELESVIAAIGGPRAVKRRLRGWMFLSGFFYEKRMKAIIQHHDQSPSEPAYPHTR